MNFITRLTVVIIFSFANIENIYSYDVILSFPTESFNIGFPIRYYSNEDLSNLKSNFQYQEFYLTFLEAVLEKQENIGLLNIEEMELCIFEKLKDGIQKYSLNKKYVPPSLQLMSLVCCQEQIQEGAAYIYHLDTDKEKLILTLNNLSFVKYLLRDGEKKHVQFLVDNTDCIKFPDQKHCIKYKCSKSDNALDYNVVRCGHSLCESFGFKNHVYLEKQLSDFYVTLQNNPEEKIEALGKINLAREDLLKIFKTANFRERMANLCFKCPAGSQPNDYGMSCIDSNGCDVLVEKYNKEQGRCVGGNEIPNICHENCKRALEDISFSLSRGTLSDKYTLHGIPINISELNLDSQVQVRSEVLNILMQAQESYSLEINKCRDYDIDRCTSFKSDFLKLKAKYTSCPTNMSLVVNMSYRNSSATCEKPACVECVRALNEHMEKYEHVMQNPSDYDLYRSCGNSIFRQIVSSIDYPIRQRLIDSSIDCGNGRPFERCVVSTEYMSNQVLNEFAYRVGFPCAMNISLE